MKFQLTYILAASLLLGACQGSSEAPMSDAQGLTLLADRSDLWSSYTESPLTFAEGVYWFDEDDFGAFRYVDGHLDVPAHHPAASLTSGDTVVTDYGDGLWRRIESRNELGGWVMFRTTEASVADILESGVLVGRPVFADGSTRQQALSVCTGIRCSGDLDFRFDNPDALNWFSASGLELTADSLDFEFNPTLRYEVGIDREEGAYSRFRVTGDLAFSARVVVRADRPASTRASFPIWGSGGDGRSVAIAWRSRRNSAFLPPEEPRVSQYVILDGFDQLSGASARLTDDSLVIETREVAAEFEADEYDDSNSLEVEGGVNLNEFVGWFNSTFGETPYRARLIYGPSSFSANLFIYREDSENRVAFSVLGRRINANPKLDFAYSVSASAAGRIKATTELDARIDGGWICYEKTGCRFDGAGVSPGASVKLDSTVTHGQPWIDLQMGVRPQVVLKRGASGFSKVSVGRIQARTQIQTEPPRCLDDQTLRLGYEISRLGRRIHKEEGLVREASGTVPEVDGCSGRAEPPLDCSVCEVSGDAQCVESICGPESACLLGRCTIAAPYDVALSWTASEPPVDLDLWVQLADGRVVHPGRLVEGPLTHANQSDGGISSQIGTSIGECVGDYDRTCDSVAPSAGECPPLCTLIPSSDGACRPEAATCTEWYESFGNCPPDCRVPCVPGVDDECITPCDGDDCFACVGQVSVDYTGCSGQSSEAECLALDQCGWHAGSSVSSCEGGRVRCEALDRSQCDVLDACSWSPKSDAERLEFPPFVERVALNRLVDDAIELWVVNASGTERTDPVPFELSVRVREGREETIQGFIDTETNARSLIYRFDVEGP